MAHVQAALESRKSHTIQHTPQSPALHPTLNQPLRAMQNHVDQPVSHSTIEFFDATMARRNRVRNAGQNSGHTAAPAQHVASAVSQFDATQSRKTARRSVASQVPHSPQVAATSSFGNGNGHTHVGNGNGNGSRVASPVPAAPVNQPPVIPPVAQPTAPANLTPAPVSAAASSHAGRASLEQFLVDFIVDQTGYPPEIIEVDWDLEADLGIDSIKRAQLFGELREVVDLDSAATEGEELKLDQFNTIRQIVDFLETLPGKHTWMSETSNGAADLNVEAATVVTQPVATQPAAAQPVATQPTNGPDAAVVEQFLVDFVVDQTGYPPEIVELDADFEADLGIDSIKKAQLIGELSEQFGLTEESAGSSGLGDLRTLRDVVNLINTAAPASATNTTSAPVSVAQQESPVADFVRQPAATASTTVPAATTRRMTSVVAESRAQPLPGSNPSPNPSRTSDYDQGYESVSYTHLTLPTICSV